LFDENEAVGFTVELSGMSDEDCRRVLWRRKLNRLWKLCGPMERKTEASPISAHVRPHITAKARREVRDVAELLGGTEEIDEYRGSI
jgi:hypothetical protein